VVSGIALGELVSLTLAPAMLVAMLVLIARELRSRRKQPKRAGSPRLNRLSELEVTSTIRTPTTQE
jgi:hypothetical protein